MQLNKNVKIAASLYFALATANIWAGPNDPNVATQVPLSADYKIGAGDILSINVWKEPDASVPGAVVRSDGKISVPLLKDVSVQGLTTAEVERILTQRLAEFIPGADVTVLVRESHSKKIYMLGAVKREGPLPMQGPMTTFQAIAEAGGFTDYAKPKKIYVIRSENGKQKRLPFDYEAVIKGENPEKDIALQADDVIFVPK
jgi:polysaccharide export outer membrane protein